MENDVGRFFEQWSADQDAMRQLAPDGDSIETCVN